MNRPRPFSKVPGWILACCVIGYTLWVVYPMIWMAFSSLKPDAEIFRHAFAPPSPGDLRFGNYAHAWTDAHFGAYFVNSVVVTLGSVALILVLGAPASYAISRFRMAGGRLLFWLFLTGLTLPAQLAIVPLFFEMRAAGLLNTRLGLTLVYAANGLPFAVFVLSAFFRSLPRSLHEAAIIDGCGEFSAFRRVMLPMARPGLVTVAIFQFIGVWKEYFFAFMLTGGDSAGSARTLPLGLANLAITSQYRSDYGMLFAGLVLVTVPILLVYLLLQRHIVKGVTAGALKG
ncbi:trehalose transport system permease protein SugB [mine drainage metagenome]|uniref:Trehalose transport system permease protein SugB n=1 Tax=mine drainage metagenome TaxID=410659 RepID=A0A1J5S8Z3_9ZZZZ